MKINRNEIRKAMKLIRMVTRHGSLHPALSAVRLESEKGALTLETFNADTALTITMPTEDKETATLILDAKQLGVALNKLRGEYVHIDSVKDGAMVSANGQTFGLVSPCGADEMPDMPADHTETQKGALAVSHAAMVRILNRVIESVSTDESRRHLNAIKLELTPDTLRAIATDGHRLATAEETIKGNTLTETEILVEPTSLRVLHETIHNTWEEDHAAAWRAGNYLWWALLGETFAVRIAGKVREDRFPPWEKVVPSDWSIEAEIDLPSTVKAMRAAKSTRNRMCLFTVSAEGIHLTTTDPDTDSIAFTETLAAGVHINPTSEHSEPTFETAFDPKYIFDAVEGLDGDTVRFSFGADPLDPVVIQETESPYSGVALVMPMRK